MQTDSADSVAAALGRIAEGDAALRAWAHVDANAACADLSGPLAGIPFGVKDVIDVRGMPTRRGLDFYEEKPTSDAWCVAALRAAGAIPVGKTWTTALAFLDPAPTRNPHDPQRTPGGSSAGSAAAVAAGHVLFAFGTQTIGSVTRPAAYCGIVGYKPTYGTIPAQGVGPLAPSLDHVGVLAASAEIVSRVAEIFVDGIGEVALERPRIAFDPEQFAERFPARVAAALEACAARLERAGARIERLALPALVDEAPDRAATILAYEAHAVLTPYAARGIPPRIGELVARGGETARSVYRDALAWRRATRPILEELLAGYDALLVPVADAAPSRDSTGDGVPSSPWTFWGFPSLSFPSGIRAEGLPIGAQIVGASASDARLLAVARWIEQVAP